MRDLLAAWKSATRRWSSDWLFLALSLASLLCAGWEARAGFERRTLSARLETCLAQADAGCAKESLEALRSLEQDSLRIQVAQANLKIIIGPDAGGERALGELRVRANARGDFQLAQGDLLRERQRFDEARQHYRLAQHAVSSPRLIDLRLGLTDQLEERLEDSRQRFTDSLRDDVERLPDVARSSDYERTERASKSVALRGAKLPLAIRDQLDSVTRQAMRIRYKASELERLNEEFARNAAPAERSPPLDIGRAGTERLEAARQEREHWLRRDRERRAEAALRLELEATRIGLAIGALVADAHAQLDLALAGVRRLPLASAKWDE
jgi:hypothetical protein